MIGRWGIQHQTYPWAQCRFCGIAGNDCPRSVCLACDTIQCQQSSRCRVCRYGVIAGYAVSPDKKGRYQRTCGYVGCVGPRAAEAPRVGWVCIDHLARPNLKVGGETVSLAEHIRRRVAIRDGAAREQFPLYTFIWHEEAA